MWWVWMFTAAEAKKVRTIDPAPPTAPVVAAPLAVARAEPGSLFNEYSARRMMGLDNGARQVGDLVTVLLLEQTNTSLGATTDLSRESANEASIDSLLGLEKTIADAHPGMGGKLSVSGGMSSTYNGTGATTRGSEISTSLTCKVIEVMPNGNLRLWGYKKVRVNRETQYVVISGVVRPRDIQMDNTVKSDRLSEAQFEVTGTGVVADKQGSGIGTRLLDRLWPF